MIVPDINLLVYAHNEAAPLHGRARAWWEDLMSREMPIGLPWAVVFGFVRLVTHPAVLESPVPATEALERAESWLQQPNVETLEPGPRHLRIVHELFEATGLAAGLTTDTHIAAIAIEHQAEIHSNDADFGRFPGLRWSNPLAATGRCGRPRVSSPTRLSAPTRA
ncbi:MAG: type II toxin-antitoxin system VapC family toxin [Candidatus Binatia bacterium]